MGFSQAWCRPVYCLSKFSSPLVRTSVRAAGDLAAAQQLIKTLLRSRKRRLRSSSTLLQTRDGS